MRKKSKEGNRYIIFIYAKDGIRSALYIENRQAEEECRHRTVFCGIKREIYISFASINCGVG